MKIWDYVCKELTHLYLFLQDEPLNLTGETTFLLQN